MSSSFFFRWSRFTWSMWERAYRHSCWHDRPGGRGHHLRRAGTLTQTTAYWQHCYPLAILALSSYTLGKRKQRDNYQTGRPQYHPECTLWMHTHTHAHAHNYNWACVVLHFKDWCGKLLALQAINPSPTPRGQWLCACVCVGGQGFLHTHARLSRAASEPHGLVNPAVHFLWRQPERGWNVNGDNCVEADTRADRSKGAVLSMSHTRLHEYLTRPTSLMDLINLIRCVQFDHLLLHMLKHGYLCAGCTSANFKNF